MRVPYFLCLARCFVLWIAPLGWNISHARGPSHSGAGWRFAHLDVDVRTDAPRFEVFRNGEFSEERTDLTELWREDLVALLLGCSFTFEHALLAEGLPVRHIDAGRNVPMYRTNLECTPVGPFAGGMVVSMRGYPAELVERVSEITGRFPGSHGAPVHAGDPAEIGIADLMTPDFGDAPVLE